MIEIRNIRPSDVDSCHRIVCENWNKEVGKRFLTEVTHAWAMDMEMPPSYYVADNEHGEVVAFAGMMASFLMDGVWDLIWSNVKKEFQREGIGKKLMEYRLNEIKRCNGSVVHLMTQSPAYFSKFGFEIAKSYGSWKLMSLWLGTLTLKGM